MMEDVVLSMTAEELNSIVLQVCVALCIAQQRIGLKHHDLHVGNIMLEDVKNPEDWDGVDIVSIPNVGEVQVPRCKWKAVLIDYGLSQARDPETGFEIRRLDEELLMADQLDEEASTGSSWGCWGAPLEGDEGYDLAMLTETLVEELFAQRPLDLEKLKLCVKLQKVLPCNMTARGRPQEVVPLSWRCVFDALKN